MKNLKFLTYLFAALLMVTTVSCSDDDDDNDATPDKEVLLTGDVWTGNRVYFGGQDVTEMYKDIFDVTTTSIEFETDGTYTATLPGEPDENGTWEFANNQSQIILNEGTADAMTIDINKLTESELWTEGEYLGAGEGRIEIRFVR